MEIPQSGAGYQTAGVPPILTNPHWWAALSHWFRVGRVGQQRIINYRRHLRLAAVQIPAGVRSESEVQPVPGYRRARVRPEPPSTPRLPARVGRGGRSGRPPAATSDLGRPASNIRPNRSRAQGPGRTGRTRPDRSSAPLRRRVSRIASQWEHQQRCARCTRPIASSSSRHPLSPDSVDPPRC